MKKFILIILFCILYSSNIQSQQIARAEAVNSLELILKHNTMRNPAEDLYDDIWDHTKVNCYTELDPTYNHSINLTKFSMPIQTSKIVVTSPYGYRRQFKRHHRGIDLKLYTGDTIYASFSGKIRISNYEAKGYGNYIVIRHFNGLETIYGHMSKRLVKPDEYVYAGQPIGLGGNTGRSTGSHLHLETRFCGIPIDPRKIFNFEYQDVTGDTFIFSK